MLQALAEFIEQHKLLSSGESVIVGYSGGADSACLLHLLKEADYEVIAAHLHHGMRADAEAEAEGCRKVAESLEIGFLMGRADVPALSKATGTSLEEAGRTARYEFFRQCAGGLSGVKVATAHTLDDHVETMLINMARGTGMTGLAGIPVERDNIIRPLLCALREQTQAFCKERGIWVHEDPANTDARNSRTAIRTLAIPALQQVNPSALKNAARLAELIQSENALLDSMAAAMLEACEVKDGHPLAFLTSNVEVEFEREKLAHYPMPLIRRGIRLAAQSLGAALEFEHIETCGRSLVDSKKLAVTAEGGLIVAECDEQRLRIRDLTRIDPFRELLTIPGEIISDEMNWSLAAWEASESANREAAIDLDKVKGALFARQFRPGDRLERPGHGISKLQDLLTDAKVKSAAKVRLPIVCDMIGPVWVPMVGTDTRVAFVEPNGRPLALRFGPIPTD